MIAADERHGRWEVDRFGDSIEAAKDSELPELVGEDGSGGDEEPEDKAGENKPLAREAVAEPAGHGAEEGVGPHEGGADKSELHVGKVKFGAEQRKESKDGLTVRIVKEADAPEHRNDVPPVMLWHSPVASPHLRDRFWITALEWLSGLLLESGIAEVELRGLDGERLVVLLRRGAYAILMWLALCRAMIGSRRAGDLKGLDEDIAFRKGKFFSPANIFSIFFLCGQHTWLAEGQRSPLVSGTVSFIVVESGMMRIPSVRQSGVLHRLRLFEASKPFAEPLADGMNLQLTFA